MDTTVLKGWIKPVSGGTDVTIYRRELESLGVEVGTWDLIESEFQECKVSLTALEKLDPLWGNKYIWGLA